MSHNPNGIPPPWMQPPPPPMGQGHGHHMGKPPPTSAFIHSVTLFVLLVRIQPGAFNGQNVLLHFSFFKWEYIASWDIQIPPFDLNTISLNA